MTDPHVATAATLAGQAAVIPAVGFLAALGLPGRTTKPTKPQKPSTANNQHRIPPT